MEFIKGMTSYQRLVTGLIAILIIVTGGFKTWEAFNPQAAQISKNIVSSVVGDVMDEKLAPLEKQLNDVRNKVVEIEKNQPKVQDSTDVRLMDFHLNQMTSIEEANNQITAWEDQMWGSQLIAMKYVARNPECMEYLEKVVVNEDVFKTFQIRSVKYR